MSINELFNKDPDIVPEGAPLIILYSKCVVCIAENGKYAKHTSHISRKMHFVRNGVKYKMHKIDWCEVGLQFADIAAKNDGEHYLTPCIKYIMIRLDK